VNRTWVFDGQEQLRLYERKKEFLERLFKELCPYLDLRSGLDAGCGIGLFSKCLSELGLRVTAFDARSENIAEAKQRYPEVEFVVWDVEDRSVRELESFDLVLCFGLLCHLENPFLAIRNLHAITGKILILESMVAPTQSPVATLMNEVQEEGQGLHDIAFVPSEACIIKMLYQAGFPEVYKTVQLPDHEDFREMFFHYRRRTVLVASKVRLKSHLLQRVTEPQPQRPDIWWKRWVLLVPPICKRLWLKIYAVRSRIFSWLPPLPVRLPWGDWWLAYGDAMGMHILLHDNFEQGEQGFLQQFIRPGMAILDIGAHHGLYSLLASKKVSPGGHVIAFEPSPRELRRLRRHLSLNRRRNVQVEPLALGNTEETRELYVVLGQETGCNSLRQPAISDPVKKVRVPVTTIDRYIQRTGIQRVDFVKLDVEGAELEVLKGGSRLLSDFKPAILCELADVRTGPWGYRSMEIYEFLAALGYRWFSITPEGRLLSCPKKEYFHENLLAVPDEKLKLVTDSIIDESGEQCID
jgi:FkbM family methyltransferase